MDAATRLQALLSSIGTRSEAWIVEEPSSLLDAGEWGVAFEALADNVYDAEMSLFHGEVVEFEHLGRHLASVSAHPPRRAWQLVHELVVADADEGGDRSSPDESCQKQ